MDQKQKKLQAEQADRAAEEARLRELYPLPEDNDEYVDESYEDNSSSDYEKQEDGKEDEILPFLGELTIPIIPLPPLFVTL